ncbi:hypothetical protein, partial [Bacillus cereus]|uniref:hypothetical protein n=2 Tax=Bacillus TaxID=1386 RepID=UPI0015D4A0FB
SGSYPSGSYPSGSYPSSSYPGSIWSPTVTLTPDLIINILECIRQHGKSRCYRSYNLNPRNIQVIERILATIPSTSPSPSSQEDVINPPQSTESEEIINANGKRFKCQWVYCCQAVGPEPLFPQCQQRNENEEEEFVFPFGQYSHFPEFKAEKCGNEFGFCLSTRESTLRLLGKVIYPSDLEEELKKDVKDCFDKAMAAALIAAGPLIGAMIDQPETVPALLPQAIEIALEQGTTTFKQCLAEKFELNGLLKSKKIRLCVYHEQTRGDGRWRPLTSRDILKMLDRLSFAQFALVQLFLPGVGSYEELAQKLGIDTEKLSNQVTTGLQKLGGEGQKVIDQLKEAITNPIGTAKKGADKLVENLNNVGEDLTSKPGDLVKAAKKIKTHW